ncbi:MAG: hypothetical protein R2939_14465 [Kofleriaceae bacterium]
MPRSPLTRKQVTMFVRSVSLVATLALPLAVTVGCGADEQPPVDAAGNPDTAIATDTARVVAVAGDFAASGILSTIGVPSLAVDPDLASGAASQDPVVRALGDRLYVVNRFGVDNVTILDRDDLSLVGQHTTGTGSNPQDVAVVGSKLYVAALGSAGLVVLDLASAGALSTVDLSSLDPADGLPNCTSIIAVGDELVVTCGVLDDADPFLTPRGPGVVAIVDPDTDTLTTSAPLPAANPVGWLRAVPGVGVVAGLVPSYSDFSEGCLAAIATTPSLAVSCLVTNEVLGGYANAYDVAGDSLWIAVAGFDAAFNGFGALRRYDLTTDALDATAYSPAGQVIIDLAVCPGGEVAVTDAPAGGTSGVRLYDAGGDELTSAALSIGLPPGFGNNLACHAQ